MTVGDLNIYGLGYIDAQAGKHVERICSAVTTNHNHVTVPCRRTKAEEAHLLAETFGSVALGHGHKPYTVEIPEGRPYAYNPGSPERVNFGEETYPKGCYLVPFSKHLKLRGDIESH